MTLSVWPTVGLDLTKKPIISLFSGSFTVPVFKTMMTNAWTSTRGVKYIKHTTNNQNIINMNNYGDSQKLVLIGVQNNEKISFEHFIKHLECTHYTYMLNNAWTYKNLVQIHVIFVTRGRHPKQIII